MIRGIDFYKHCYEKIASSHNVTVVHDKVMSIQQELDGVRVFTEGGEYKVGYAFNSILFDDPLQQKNAHHLLQHFKGWVIETEEDLFDVNACTLMDFRVSQHHAFNETKSIGGVHPVYRKIIEERRICRWIEKLHERLFT